MFFWTGGIKDLQYNNTKTPLSLWVWTDKGLLMGCRIAAKVDSFSSSVLNGLEWEEMRRGIISLQMPHNSQRACLLGASIIYLSIALNFRFILAYRSLNREISDWKSPQSSAPFVPRIWIWSLWKKLCPPCLVSQCREVGARRKSQNSPQSWNRFSCNSRKPAFSAVLNRSVAQIKENHNELSWAFLHKGFLQ